MKSLLLLLILFLPPPGYGSNDWNLKGVDGKSLPAKSLQGKTTVVQFWGSWCRSCSEIFWDMADLIKVKPKLNYYTVSIDEKYSAFKKYVENHSRAEFLKSRSFHDGKKILSTRMKVETVPTLMLLDQSGKELFRLEGHYNSSEWLKFRSLLERENKS